MSCLSITRCSFDSFSFIQVSVLSSPSAAGIANLPCYTLLPFHLSLLINALCCSGAAVCVSAWFPPVPLAVPGIPPASVSLGTFHPGLNHTLGFLRRRSRDSICLSQVFDLQWRIAVLSYWLPKQCPKILNSKDMVSISYLIKTL